MFLFKRFVGIILIAFGVTASLLPVLPGFPFVIIGLELVGLGFLIPETIRHKMKAWGHQLLARVRRS